MTIDGEPRIAESEAAASPGPRAAPGRRADGFPARFVRRLARGLAALDPRRRRRRAGWLRREGVAFLRELGLGPGDAVLDFGCGGGAYTLPAALLVGRQGRVVAVDVTLAALREVTRAAASLGLRNVRTAGDLAGAIKALAGRSCAAVLLHDVLQFFDAPGRAGLYTACRGLLRGGGTLSVIPTHMGAGHGRSRHFADMTVDVLVREIEAAGFGLRHRGEARVWHGSGFRTETALRFAAPGEGEGGDG